MIHSQVPLPCGAIAQKNLTSVSVHVLAHRAPRSFVIAPEVGVEPTFACKHRRMSRGSATSIEAGKFASLIEKCRTARLFRRNVPPSGIEPEPPGLQPSAQTIYARVASCDRAAGRDRVIVIDYSVVICPVPAVSLSSRCERSCSGDRRFTRGAVGRSSGKRNRTSIARSRISRPTVRRSLIDLLCAWARGDSNSHCLAAPIKSRVHNLSATSPKSCWWRCV